MGQQNQDDYYEINLYDLWQILWKRKILIISFSLIVVLLSAIYSSNLPNIYKGYTVFNIIRADLITTITSREIVDLLGNVDREKQMSILPTTYPYVREVKFTALKNSKNMIMVTIDSTNLNDIPQALVEVQNYLNNTNIIKMNTAQNKEILLKQSAELSELINSSPDLLATYHKLFKAGKLATMGFNPIDVNQAVIGIKMSLLKIDQEILKLNNGGLEMAMQPYVSSTPVGPRILRNTALAGTLSLLFGVCLSFLLAYFETLKKKKIRAVENSSNE